MTFLAAVFSIISDTELFVILLCIVLEQCKAVSECIDKCHEARDTH